MNQANYIEKKKGPKHTHLAMQVSHVLDFCGGIHRYSALTYDIMKSYLTRVRDKKIRNGYITLGTRVVL